MNLSKIEAKDILIKYEVKLIKLYFIWSTVTILIQSMFEEDLCLYFANSVYSIFFDGYSVFWYLWAVIIASPLIFIITVYQRNLFIISFWEYAHSFS